MHDDSEIGKVVLGAASKKDLAQKQAVSVLVITCLQSMRGYPEDFRFW